MESDFHGAQIQSVTMKRISIITVLKATSQVQQAIIQPSSLELYPPLLQWAALRLTVTACMTWREIYLSGVGIGMANRRMLTMLRILLDLHLAHFELVGAEAGSPMRYGAALPTATTTRLPLRTTVLASALLAVTAQHLESVIFSRRKTARSIFETFHSPKVPRQMVRFQALLLISVVHPLLSQPRLNQATSSDHGPVIPLVLPTPRLS